MSSKGKIALLLSVVMVLVSYWISANIFESIPHIEDEIAYVWQARVISEGNLVIASPPCPKCFLVPFVVDYNGIRFGKYPPGWPAVLAIGIQLGMKAWVNPILAGFSLWLLFLLVKKVVNENAALIACGLMLTSPFVLMNSGNLLSHIWSLWLTLVFIHGWLDLFSSTSDPRVPRWLKIIVSSFALGLLALTRPLTMLAIAFPFIIHGIIILIKKDRRQKVDAIFVALIAILLSSMLFVWQSSVTGDPLLNPYQLWWPYDRLGFGPEVGLQPGGYSLIYARMNAKFSLGVGLADLFGWFRLSWLFLPTGLFAIARNRKAWLITSIFPGIILVYTFYWIGSWLFGPRYYFEGIIALFLLSAAGIQFTAGKFKHSKNLLKNWRWIGVTAITIFLMNVNIFYYLPQRLGNMRGLYGANKDQLTPFLSASAQKLTPALVIVHKQKHWIEYGTLLELSSPYLNSPWLVTYSRGDELDQFIASQFPNRSIWHYYPDQPDTFYTAERPD